MRFKSEELQARYDEVLVRRQNIQAMEKTKVALEMLESTDLSISSKVTEAILGASERQHEDWQDKREISGKSDNVHTNEVKERLSSILGNERKAIQ